MLRQLVLIGFVCTTLALGQTAATTAEAPMTFPAWASDSDKLKTLLQHGKYLEVISDELKINPTAERESVQIRATALSALGRSAEALTLLGEASDPNLVLTKARILSHTGDEKSARQLLESLLQKDPNSIAAHYQLGRVCEKLGDTPAATAAYAWFAAPEQDFIGKWSRNKDSFDNAEQVTQIGEALDRWANLTGAFAKQPQLNDLILSFFTRSYDVIDRNYWPARVAAAEYQLAHDDSHSAEKELDAAAEINPHDETELNLMARIGISEFNFDRGDATIKLIRQTDPQSFSADLLEARNLMQQRDPKDAKLAVERALTKQPTNLEALGLLAAAEALQLHTEAMTDALHKVEAIDPDNATAYFEVAQQLGAMRQYPRAEAMYKIAIDRQPTWTAARNLLGLLYTQSGDEDAARATLESAHAVDPYNIATTNYLRLLDDLSKFARKESANFVVFYDPQADPIIPEYFSDYLESIHAEVAGIYKQDPPVKTYIEVFPTHDAFSVRTTGNAWIPTVGASTGRVIALVAPRRGENTMGPFNWSQVLRHEYTHTVTLAATDNRIAHWFTEGLAVYQEHSPLKWEWVPMLYEATTKHELFTIENLTWGFIRPKKPTDRSLAYAESYWVCCYIEEKWHHEAILKMLASFRGGADEETTFKNVLGQSREEFQKDFFAWCDQQVSSWGYDEATTAKYDALREKGESLVRARQFADAVPVWQEIAKLRPVDALPHQRLAGLYLRPEVHQIPEAIEQLKALDAVELKDNAFAKRIARLFRDENDLANAQHFALEAVYIDPYDPAAHDLLLDIATKAHDTATIDRETRVKTVLADWMKTKPTESN